MSRSRSYIITLALFGLSSASANATSSSTNQLEEKLAICINTAMPNKLSTETIMHFDVDETHLSKRFKRSSFIASITDVVTGANVGEVHCEFGFTGKVTSAKLIAS